MIKFWFIVISIYPNPYSSQYNDNLGFIDEKVVVHNFKTVEECINFGDKYIANSSKIICDKIVYKCVEY
jgi:hypothetical protein